MLSIYSMVMTVVFLFFVVLYFIPVDDEDESEIENEEIDDEREYYYVFEDYGIEKVTNWVKNLDLFHYTTHQWDKGAWVQNFELNIKCLSEEHVYECLEKLGVEPEFHNVVDEENSWQYSSAIPKLVNPSNCQIDGINFRLHIFKSKKLYFGINLLIFDEHELEDLSEKIFQLALRLEAHLKKLNFSYIRPGRSIEKYERHYVSKESHPELWE